jgi:hypothetical protein
VSDPTPRSKRRAAIRRRRYRNSKGRQRFLPDGVEGKKWGRDMIIPISGIIRAIVRFFKRNK